MMIIQTKSMDRLRMKMKIISKGLVSIGEMDQRASTEVYLLLEFKKLYLRMEQHLKIQGLIR